MKIGILTQHLGHNYGGILQAYALQKKLLQLGYNSVIFDIRLKSYDRSIISKLLSIISRIIKRNIFRVKSTKPPMRQWDFSDRIKKVVYRNTFDFIKRHILMTEQIIPEQTLKYNFNRFDCFIVGSDQVWRPKYNKYIQHSFLDFVENKKDIKRIAYAASFGVDVNEFSEEMLKICKPLAKKFDSVSVREDSGVRLCKDLFDVEAVHLIDPTMFFDAEHYEKLSKEKKDYKNDGNCFAYILDRTSEKDNIIEKVCNKYRLKPFNVLPKSNFLDVGPKHVEDCVMPPIEQWLDGFNKAKFVITDSFHGTVFSIIFKKPFLVIGNKTRGMARFESLLRMFKLENRLIQSENDLTEELLNCHIDYEAVHEILAKERAKAINFLSKNLKDN